MPLLKPPSLLETERLVLRRFFAADSDPFYALINDERTARYFDFSPQHRTPEGAKALLQWVIRSYDGPNPIFVLAITEKEERRYLGAVGLVPARDMPDPEVFVAVRSDARDRGFATEAMHGVFRYAVVELGFERVLAFVSVDNVAAQKMCAHIMSHDGVVERQPKNEKQHLYTFSKANL